MIFAVGIGIEDGRTLAITMPSIATAPYTTDAVSICVAFIAEVTTVTASALYI
jgi:hypothetical protein